MTADQWHQILTQCGVKDAQAREWAPHFEQEVTEESFSLGFAEIDDFVGQVLHESGMLSKLEENLNYSATRLMKVWPKRFPEMGAAVDYEHNPSGLAEKVYGGRMGNDQEGDGWKYRGSGPIMVTGKANFQHLQDVTGLELVLNPDQLRRPGPAALKVCIAWWEGNVPDGVMGNCLKVTKAVNGGTIGYEDRAHLTAKVSDAIATA